MTAQAKGRCLRGGVVFLWVQEAEHLVLTSEEVAAGLELRSGLLARLGLAHEPGTSRASQGCRDGPWCRSERHLS